MASITISMQVVEIQHGLWCHECALSSGVQVTLSVASGSRLGLTCVRRCGDCGGDDVGVD